MADLVGATLGQYKILKLLGRGEIANVYKAWQPSLRRHAALVVLNPPFSYVADFVQSFQDEAVAAADLKHANIATIHDVGTEDDRHYVAIEFIAGSSLRERIRSRGAVPLKEAVDIVTQAANALDYAHQRGFIHHNVNPSNILIDKSGRAVVTDFGIAKAPSTISVAVTPTETSPAPSSGQAINQEQTSNKPPGRQADIYALYIISYLMLTGRLPSASSHQHSPTNLRAPVTPPLSRTADSSALPPEVEALMHSVIASEPTARYDSAGDFAAALSRACASSSPHSDKPSRHVRWPLVVGAGVTVAVFLLGMALATVLLLADEPSLEKKLTEAGAALNQERYDEAIERFKDALAQDPDNVEALKGAGYAYEAQEEWQKAADFFQKWVQVLPDNPEGRIKLGWMFHNGDLPENAVAEFGTATSLQADSIDAWKGLGLSLISLAEYEKAAQSLEEWIALDPEAGQGYGALGLAYAQMDDAARALPAQQRYVRLEPANPEARQSLGWAYLHADMPDEAIETFEMARSLGADSASTHEGLGRAYMQLQMYDVATSHFEQWIHLQADNSEAFRWWGWASYLDGRYEEAVNALKTAVVLNPDRSEAALQLGRAYFQLEQFDDAIETFERVISAGDRSVSAYYWLGRSYTRTEDLAKARSNLEQAIALGPQHYAAHYRLGWVYIRLKQYTDAIAAFNDAIALNPASVDALNGAAFSASKINDCERAIRYYQKMLELDPDDERATRGLTQCGQ